MHIEDFLPVHLVPDAFSVECPFLFVSKRNAKSGENLRGRDFLVQAEVSHLGQDSGSRYVHVPQLVVLPGLGLHDHRRLEIDIQFGVFDGHI